MRIRRDQVAIIIISVFLLVLVVTIFYLRVVELQARIDGLEALVRALHRLDVEP